MAIIYGMADSERRLLNKLPGEVRKLEDIDRVKKEFEDKVANEGDGIISGIKKWNYVRQINKFGKEEG